MPCDMHHDYGPPYRTLADRGEYPSLELQKNLQTTVHNMSVEIDRLRELIYLMYNESDWSKFTSDIEEVLDDQVNHRQDDLNRLAAIFANDLPQYREELRKVLDADPSKPLEPQLGFNPDDF